MMHSITLRQPRHLYPVTTIPSETNATNNASADDILECTFKQNSMANIIVNLFRAMVISRIMFKKS